MTNDDTSPGDRHLRPVGPPVTIRIAPLPDGVRPQHVEQVCFERLERQKWDKREHPGRRQYRGELEVGPELTLRANSIHPLGLAQRGFWRILCRRVIDARTADPVIVLDRQVQGRCEEYAEQIRGVELKVVRATKDGMFERRISLICDWEEVDDGVRVMLGPAITKLYLERHSAQ